MKIKKLLSVVLAVIMAFSVCPAMNVFAVEERTVVDSGICGVQGDNLTWTLYDDGELVISGKGKMSFYYISEKGVEISSPLIPPWYDYFDDIRVITIEDCVTGIGDDASDDMYYNGEEPKVYWMTNIFTHTLSLDR